MRGTYRLKSWSSTQKNVTLSSAEASGEALGMLQLMSSVGVPMTASVMVDSSAALAVVARKGNGKLRHVREMLQPDKVVDMPVLFNDGVVQPRQFLDKVVDMLVGVHRQLFVATVQKTVVVPQLPCIDKVVDVLGRCPC